jgi:hypothetical protein
MLDSRERSPINAEAAVPPRSEQPNPPELRPGNLAQLLLAASGVPPRARARDQQADMVGDALRRAILDRLIVLDPEPDQLEATLLAIIAETDEPSGAARGVCSTIAQEWEMAQVSPNFVGFVIEQAVEAESLPKRGKRGGRP